MDYRVGLVGSEHMDAVREVGDQTGQINEMIVHAGTHLDEMVAVWFLRKFSKNKDVAVRVWRNTGEPFRGKDSWQWLKEGVAIIGCFGSGPFNHHPPEQFPEICSADQVVAFLGIDKLPELAKILKRTRVNDLNGGGEFVVLAEYLRFKNIQTSEDFEEAYIWVVKYLERFYAEQVGFQSEQVGEEFARCTRKWNIRVGKKAIPVVTIDGSDLENIARFARNETGAEVVVVKRSTGNVQIFSYPVWNKRMRRVSLGTVVAILRLLEQRCAGNSTNEDIDDLRQEGLFWGWYFQEGPQWILNGSKTAQVEPTKIPLARIEEVVMLGVQREGMDNSTWLRFCKETRGLDLKAQSLIA